MVRQIVKAAILCLLAMCGVQGAQAQDTRAYAQYCRYVGNDPYISLFCSQVVRYAAGGLVWSDHFGLYSGMPPGDDTFLASVVGQGKPPAICTTSRANPLAGSDSSISCATREKYGFIRNVFASNIDLGYPDLPRFMADANGDGRADFCRLVGDRPGRIACLLSSGEVFGPGEVSSPAPIDVGYGDLPRFMADVNGDGKSGFLPICRRSTRSTLVPAIRRHAFRGHGNHHAHAF
jgi:hypothetical protein